MKMKWLPIAAAVTAALASQAAFAVDFHGYFRSGVGVSKDGDMQTVIKKQKVGRLGHEDDTYGEVQLGQEVFNKDGKTFYVDSMVAMTSNGSNDWESTESRFQCTGANGVLTKCDNKEDATFALRQFNVQAKGLLNFAPEATLWAGKRYYQRHDIHISDFYYWNISGAGAGIEGIQAGPGKVSFAWVRNDRSGTDDGWTYNDDLNVNTLDLRYAGIPLWQDASLEVGVDYAIANPTDAQKNSSNAQYKNAKDGVMLTAELTAGVLGGFNKSVVQYGTEGYSKAFAFWGDGSWYGAEAKDGADGFRLINWGVLPVGDKVEFGHQLIYAQAKDFTEWGTQYDDKDTFSAVVRPMYKWNDVMKTIAEVGYFKDNQTTKGGVESSTDGTKYTLAQAWSAGSSWWARPEIRVFASYVQQDGQFRADCNGVQQDDAWNFGVQAEAWW